MEVCESAQKGFSLNTCMKNGTYSLRNEEVAQWTFLTTGAACEKQTSMELYRSPYTLNWLFFSFVLLGGGGFCSVFEIIVSDTCISYMHIIQEIMHTSHIFVGHFHMSWVVIYEFALQVLAFFARLSTFNQSWMIKQP